jgi:DNA polymerase III delta subunit
MIIYLYGLDSYRRAKKLREIVSAYRNKYRDIDLLEFDLEENPSLWIKVRDFLSQPSLFVESKVAIVKGSGAVTEKEGGKEWAKVLKSFVKTPKVFIIISDAGKPKREFSFLLDEPVEGQEFDELEGKTLDAFLRKEGSERGLSFDPKAFEFLVRYIGQANGRSWAAVNALDMIALGNFKKAVLEDDLKEFFRIGFEEEVYHMAQDFMSKDGWKSRVSILEKAFHGAADAHFFNSLGFQARGKDALTLADYDIAVKSGGLEYEEALTSFALGG